MLCLSCHKDKSQSEQEDGSYIKIVESESSFNNQVRNIMSSDLGHRYAFIEHVVDLNVEPTNDNPILLKAKLAYKRELSNNNMSEEEIDEIISRCDWSNFITTEPKKQKSQRIFNIDIQKCRKNNLYYSPYNLPTFTIMDNIKPFNNNIVDGTYYVETDQSFQ